MKLPSLILALVAHVFLVDGLKVLSVFPFGSTSHFAIGHSIVKTLHAAGHEVTVVSPFPKKNAPQNFTYISTAEIAEKTKGGKKV